MIHPLAEVKTNHIGENTRIWQFSIVLEQAVIGSDCNINSHTFIENDVVIGNRVTVKSGVYLWDGIHVEDDVFIGPNVTFTNDKYPRSKQYPDSFQRTVLRKNASIGAASVILGGVTIGEYALIAAGSVVTRDVPSRALVQGNPARIMGWVNLDGTRMSVNDGEYTDQQGKKWTVVNNQLTLL